jgi:predicted RNA-binding protein with RPS1 domain
LSIRTLSATVETPIQTDGGNKLEAKSPKNGKIRKNSKNRKRLQSNGKANQINGEVKQQNVKAREANGKSKQLNGKANKKKKTQGKARSEPIANIAKKSSGRKKFTKKITNKKLRLPLRSLKLGSKIDGVVKEIVPFGAFIQTKYKISGNGLALIHKSQIQNEIVKDVKDHFKVGQKIEARVIAIDHEKNEVALSTRPKRLPRKPLGEVEIGQEYTGRVKQIMDYGAFIDFGCVRDALLHISRLSMDKVDDIGNYLEVGQEVNFHIIDVDAEKKSIAASMLTNVADAYLDRRRKNN